MINLAKGKLTLALTLFTIITSCAERHGSVMAKKIYANKDYIKNSSLTKTGVLKSYKEPTYKWNDISGNVVYNYQYIEEVPFLYSYIPLFSFFKRPISELNRYDISLTFDKDNNKLVQSTFEENKFER